MNVGILIRSLGGLGYVAADDDIRDALLELGHGVFYTFIIDAHAVDEGVVFYESERAGLGIARLRLGGEGAYLHETEAEVAHVVVELSVLVQTCRPTGFLNVRPNTSRRSSPSLSLTRKIALIRLWESGI